MTSSLDVTLCNCVRKPNRIRDSDATMLYIYIASTVLL